MPFVIVELSNEDRAYLDDMARAARKRPNVLASEIVRDVLRDDRAAHALPPDAKTAAQP